MALAASTIAIPKTNNSHSNSTVKERTAPNIKKSQNSDKRTFSTVLEQSKGKNAKEINFGPKNEEMEKEEGTRATQRVRAKKKLIKGGGLNNGRLESETGERKLDTVIRKKLRHLSKNENRSQAKQSVLDASGNTPDQPVLAANEIVRIDDRSGSKNRRSDLSDSSLAIGRVFDGKRGDNLTSVAPRVEIQDRRPGISKADTVSRTRIIRRNLDHAGEEINREFGSENRPMTAEMEIEIPPRLEGRDSRRSAAMDLVRKLDDQIGNEIVRGIKIVLKSASTGELRINLRPENLGRVRVQIQMEDNRLRGRFFVESAAAREVLKGALDGLQAKLLESGFSSADLEMDRDYSSTNFWFNNDNPRGRNILRRDVALEFENSISPSLPDGLSENLVNLFV